MKNKLVAFLLGWLASLAIVVGVAFALAEKILPTLLLCGGVLVAQLAISFFAFRAAEARKRFHGGSLRIVSVIILALLALLSLVYMLFDLPLLVMLAVGVLLLAAQVLVVCLSVEVKPDAVEAVQKTDAQIKAKTECIRTLTAEAQSLMMRPALDEGKKELARRVYEAIRYSDPMSCEGLLEIEQQIKESFAAFSLALCGSSKEDERALCDSLLALVAERNNKCRLLK